LPKLAKPIDHFGLPNSVMITGVEDAQVAHEVYGPELHSAGDHVQNEHEGVESGFTLERGSNLAATGHRISFA
jgi:hypothetical protein